MKYRIRSVIEGIRGGELGIDALIPDTSIDMTAKRGGRKVSRRGTGLRLRESVGDFSGEKWRE